MTANTFFRSATSRRAENRWHTAVHIAGYAVGAHLVGEFTHSLQISGKKKKLKARDGRTLRCSGLADLSGFTIPMPLLTSSAPWSDPRMRDLVISAWPATLGWIFVAGAGHASEALVNETLFDAWLDPREASRVPAFRKSQQIMSFLTTDADDQHHIITSVWGAAHEAFSQTRTREAVIALANELSARGSLGLFDDEEFDVNDFLEEQLPGYRGPAMQDRRAVLDLLPPLPVPLRVQLVLQKVGCDVGYRALAA